MSIVRHHHEWLSLIESSGPFLSIPVLRRAFPQGLPNLGAERKQNFRIAYEEWEDAPAASQWKWVHFVLTHLLEYPDSLLVEGQRIGPAFCAEGREGEPLRPDFVLLDSVDTTRPRLYVQYVPPGQDLDKDRSEGRWSASPARRMLMLLRATQCLLGLVTNGDRWMLVYAPPEESVSYASWYASIWREEQITLKAFCVLLEATRFFSSAENETLEALLAESAANQQEVTDQLGLQVRTAVGVLIRSLDRADQDRGRQLLGDVAPQTLYEAALTVMMRLVFLFCAEERRLLLLEDPIYDANYAVSTLQAQLREAADQHGEEVLERRQDAWHRLLAIFRAVHSGIRHDLLLLPAYGGDLFDPDRFPFLEGRQPNTHWQTTPAAPLPVDNRTVLHLLESLQFLSVRGAGRDGIERRRLSFDGLDVEQIGHVYETLLDHTASRAREVLLGIEGGKDGDAEVSLTDLEAWQAEGDARLMAELKAVTGRSEKSLTKALQAEPELTELHRLRVACGNDDALVGRVLPFVGLLREDSFGELLILPAGSLYVSEGASRRASGSHYTPRSLTESVVEPALQPVAWHGPAEGLPREQWALRPAQDLLELRICDFACGSGAFLVGACRWLAERLVEAWDQARTKLNGKPATAPFGEPATGRLGEPLLPDDPRERFILACRLVAERCLFGVDRNPLAVEMAKLSLWLVTLSKGQAFTFLNHAIKSGDSLLGLWRREQVDAFHLAPSAPSVQQYHLWRDKLKSIFQQALERRHEIESFPVLSVADSERKARLLAEANAVMDLARAVADALVGAALATADGDAGESPAFERTRGRLLDLFQQLYHDEHSAVETVRALEREARLLLQQGNPPGQPPRRPFHWPLEFPEVFDDGGGFDVIVSNPPFIGGKKITGVLGTSYRDYLLQYLADGQRGHADLCAYFLLRVQHLLRSGGCLGMLATNTIAQGDTREVGLEQITKQGFSILRAVSSRKWPGVANLEVAHLWLRNGSWRGPRVLDDQPVKGITAFLTVPGKVAGKPYRLAANVDKSFNGSYVNGMGFILDPAEAEALIGRNPRNREVLFPYLNGEDLNSRPDQSPSRWVINFHDWPLDRSAAGQWAGSDQKQQKEWLRSGRVSADYPSPVAADYPDCLDIVERKVKPERVINNDKTARTYWWRFLRTRPELYATIAGMERVLVRSRVADLHSVAFVPTSWVLNERLTVFAVDSLAEFATLQSSLHDIWARHYGSTLRRDLLYTPSDCFETYPFPAGLSGLGDIGGRYNVLRNEFMYRRNTGLTGTYTLFHDPSRRDKDVDSLRNEHVCLDREVLRSYGWPDIEPNFSFYETPQGIRFTIHPNARQTVLDRLLALNHERYQEEVALGLHDEEPKAKSAGRRPRAAKVGATLDLFGEDHEEEA